MKSLAKLLLGISLFFSIEVPAQEKQYVYYFDRDLNPAAKETAIFVGKGTQVDSLFEFRLFTEDSNHLVAIDHYVDSSLQMGEGSSETYYASGQKLTSGFYTHGNVDRLWLKYDSTGRVTDSTIYQNGEKLSETQMGFHKNGATENIIRHNYQTNTLEKVYFNDKGMMLNKVNFTGDVGFETLWDDKGEVVGADSVFSREEIEASYPGGDAAWMKYIVSQLQKNADKIIRSGEYGSCQVKFIVDKNGRVKDAKATTMEGTVLAEVAVDIISRSPKWKPASQYGRNVNAYRIQPVTLTEPK